MIMSCTNDKIYGVIYKLTDCINGKIYIGQSRDFHKRMISHKRSPKNKSHIGKSIYNAITEHGFDNFTKEIIDTCYSQKELDEKEMYYISLYKSYFPEFGYNSFHKDDDGRLTINEGTRDRMRLSHTGLAETSSTKRKKSNRVIAIKDNKMYIIDSGKLLGDCLGTSKDMIKNCLRQPTSYKGWNIFYFDKDKIREIRDKQYTRKSIRNKRYMDLADYLLTSGVETIEKDYDVDIITYENVNDYRHTFEVE